MVACVMTWLLLVWRVFRQYGCLCYDTVARGMTCFSSVWLLVL